MTDRILFLDVDGVLNRLDKHGDRLLTVPAPWMKGSAVVDYNVAKLLCHAVAQVPRLKIVVSSSWRSLVANKTQFAAVTHVDPNLIHEDWRTPSTINRGLEIKEWLYNHPEVKEGYAIIDDTDDELIKHHGRHVILTRHNDGLTTNDIDRILKVWGYRMTNQFKVVTLGGPADETQLIIPEFNHEGLIIGES